MWIVRFAVVGAILAGIPASGLRDGRLGQNAASHVPESQSRRRFAQTGLVAGLGYAIGQPVVDLVLLIEDYALAVSLTIIAVAFVNPAIKRLLRRRGSRQPDSPDRPSHDAGNRSLNFGAVTSVSTRSPGTDSGSCR